MKYLVALAVTCSMVACSSGSPTVSVNVGAPSAMVSFVGVTSKSVSDSNAYRPYFAVASATSDELRFVDQWDLQTVVGPGMVFALSIATSGRPLLLASASLGDDLADALAVVSAGSTSLQIVDTWDVDNAVSYEIPLDGLGLGSDLEILSMIGMPARTADGVPARIVVAVADASVGATSGKLVTVEFARGSDGSVTYTPPTSTSVTDLGFRVADLALEPNLEGVDSSGASTVLVRGTRLFAATSDDISGAVGVAMIETAPSGTAAAPNAWTVSALEAKAPTVAVAVGYVVERIVSSREYCSTDDFSGSSPKLYVFAALDTTACGAQYAINCGLVTLDPSTLTLATDPASGITQPTVTVPGGEVDVPAQSYRAPMPIPGTPSHIAIGYAPSRGSQRLTGKDSDTPSTDCPTTAPTYTHTAQSGVTQTFPLLKVYPGTGERYTSAFAIVTSNNGRAYWYDLARWGPTSDTNVVYGSSVRVRVTDAWTTAVSTTLLGMWDDLDTGDLATDETTMASAIQVWPGYTDTDTWTVTYQGTLPDLVSESGVLITPDGGTSYLALQRWSGASDPKSSSAVWTAGTAVANPYYGLQVGDIVSFSDCETTVAGFLDEGTTLDGISLSGGAVELTPATCVTTLSTSEVVTTTATFRAAGFVFKNGKLGYLGRPELDTQFTVAWADEDTLATDTSRSGLEKLYLARRARRLFYPVAGPCPPITLQSDETDSQVGCYPGLPRVSDPLQPGFLVSFRLGYDSSTAAPTSADRGATLGFVTRRGTVQSYKAPSSGGTVPEGVLPFDWGATNTTSDHVDDPIRFVVPFLDDQILIFSPTGNVSDKYLK